MSGLSTFKQMPETDNSYKTINFGTKNRPSYKPAKTTVYHGVNVDEGLILNFTVHAVVLNFTAMVASLLFSINHA